MSPKTPASSKILLQTKVRLGTQIRENSCSILLFFCNRLIDPIHRTMSASNDGAELILRKENAIDLAQFELHFHLGIKTD